MTLDHPTAEVPSPLLHEAEAEERWRSRLTAIRTSLPEPARDDPNRAVYVSNAPGRFELFTFDVATGRTAQATDRSDGTTMGTLSADGRSLWWFDDTDGDEFGTWRHQGFDAAPGPGDVALPDVAPGYPAGVAVGRTLAIAGFGDDAGTRIHLAAEGEIRTVYRHECDAAMAALSTDESMWVLSHSEHGDSRYPALRALRVTDGAIVAELDDSPGRGLTALAFPPIAGDQRLLVGHERRGRDELGVWDLESGHFVEFEIDLPGDLDGDFYPDGRAVLVIQNHHGRSRLFRYEIDSQALTALPAETGVIAAAVARPDGSVWYRHSSASTAWTCRVAPAPGEGANDDGVPGEAASGDGPSGNGTSGGSASRTLSALPHSGAAGSEPVTDIWVDGPGGRIHALLARPPGSAPVTEPGRSNAALPTVFMVHGGPASADDDSFDALRAAYLDASIAVCQVNYRGSIGYGSAWRDALTARIGHTELADIAAVHDALVTRGLTDVDRSAIAGHSWGGFLALLAAGTQPTRWAAAVAGVPVADYVTAYADEMEPMRAYDRSLFGGSPAEVPDRYLDSSPLTWIDAVAAPLLIFAGENDPRCPIRQIERYLDALARRRADYAVYRFNAGHGSMVVAERVRQVACEVGFVRDRIGVG